MYVVNVFNSLVLTQIPVTLMKNILCINLGLPFNSTKASPTSHTYYNYAYILAINKCTINTGFKDFNQMAFQQCNRERERERERKREKKREKSNS